MGAGASAATALGKTGEELNDALKELKEPLQLDGKDYTFVTARPMEEERKNIYRGTFKEIEGADTVVVIVAEADGKKKEFIAVAKDGSASLVKCSCLITLADMFPTDGIEYSFNEAPDAWAIAPLSREALENYRTSKFKSWIEMLHKSECEAQLRRMLQSGVVREIFDDVVFPTPDEMKDLFKVKCEKTGKIMNIPHPVASLRVWDADKESYDTLDTILEGAPKEEEAAKFWEDLIADLKDKRGAEYIEGLLQNAAAEDEADDVCFAHIEADVAEETPKQAAATPVAEYTAFQKLDGCPAGGGWWDQRTTLTLDKNTWTFALCNHDYWDDDRSDACTGGGDTNFKGSFKELSPNTFELTIKECNNAGNKDIGVVLKVIEDSDSSVQIEGKVEDLWHSTLLRK